MFWQIFHDTQHHAVKWFVLSRNIMLNSGWNSFWPLASSYRNPPSNDCRFFRKHIPSSHAIYCSLQLKLSLHIIHPHVLTHESFRTIYILYIHVNYSSAAINGFAISSMPSCGDTNDTCVPLTTTKPSFLFWSVIFSGSSESVFGKFIRRNILSELCHSESKCILNIPSGSNIENWLQAAGIYTKIQCMDIKTQPFLYSKFTFTFTFTYL